MSSLNTAIRFRSGENTSNPDLLDLTDEYHDKDNAAFLADVARRLRTEQEGVGGNGTLRIHPGAVACIGLIGEYGIVGYALRRAQEVFRIDFTPCNWSHAFLVYQPIPDDPDRVASRKESPWVLESALDPGAGFSAFFERHGVGGRRIRQYTRAKFHPLATHSVPNIAIIAIALTEEERHAVLERANNPHIDQLNYDLSGLWGMWYSYITSRGVQVNPLTAGYAMPSAAYLQFVYDAVGIDLAPGSRQRNISPEHIWQAAKRLSPTFQATSQQGSWIERPIKGWYCVRDRACVIAPVKYMKRELPRTLSDQIAWIERQDRI